MVRVQRPLRDMNGQIPHFCLAREILDRRRIEERKLKTRTAHARGEHKKQRRKDQDQQPMHIKRVNL